MKPWQLPQGSPKAVEVYPETKNLTEVRHIQKEILVTYTLDLRLPGSIGRADTVVAYV